LCYKTVTNVVNRGELTLKVPFTFLKQFYHIFKSPLDLQSVHTRTAYFVSFSGYFFTLSLMYIWANMFRSKIDASFGEKHSDWLWGILYYVGIEDDFASKFTTFFVLMGVLFFALHIFLGRFFGSKQPLLNTMAMIGATQFQLAVSLILTIVISWYSLVLSVVFMLISLLIHLIVVFSISFKWFDVHEQSRSKYTYLFFSLFLILYLIATFSISIINQVSFFSFGSSPAIISEKEFAKKAYAAEDKQYDVIVYGGEAEGVAAAVSAARNGLHTLLIEPRNGLGGVLTFSKLNFFDLPATSNGRIVSGGIFKELHHKVNRSRVADVDQLKESLLSLVRAESKIDLSLSTKLIRPTLDGNKVTGLTIQTKNGIKDVSASRLIDASQDADFAAAAGVPFFKGSEDLNIKDRYMAVTPVIHLKGVSWKGLKKTVTSYKFGYASMTTNTVAGFGKLFDLYQPKNTNTRLRGLNIARVATKNGEEVFINALLIFNVNGLDPVQKKQALRIGNDESKHVVDFLRKEMNGFQNAEIVSPAEELYVRETRHVLAEYQLKMEDLWYNRDQWDSIGYGAYPVDIQPYTPFDKGAIVADPDRYAIPFRSLVPRKMENILVVGRSAGFSSVAFGSTRVVPTGMVTGQAAGVASKISIDANVSFRQLSKEVDLVNKMQERLSEQGAELAPFDEEHPYEGEWFDKKIGLLMNYALVLGSYNNDLQPNQAFYKKTFHQMMNNGTKRINLNWYQQNKENLLQFDAQKNELAMRDELAGFIVKLFVPNQTHTNVWKTLYDNKIIDEIIYQKINRNRSLSRAEGMYFVSSVLEYLESKSRQKIGG
jgi:hypothetical protein